jgi:hypothetical protein
MTKYNMTLFYLWRDFTRDFMHLVLTLLSFSDGNGSIPITEHKSVNLGEEVILDSDPVPDANNKHITWLYNNCRIVQKQPGQEPFLYDKNYQLMDNGNLKILKMTKQLEGKYERLGEHASTIYVKAKGIWEKIRIFHLINFI